MTKKRKIGINLVIIISIMALIFVIFSPLIKVGASEYVYTGPTGRNFTFNVDEEGGNKYHILQYSYFSAGESFKLAKNVSIPFEYSPNELEKISTINNTREKIFGSKGIFITTDPYFDPELSEQSMVARVTISRVTGSEEYNLPPHIYNIDTFRANTEEIEGDDAPILTCNNATQVGRVIHLKQGDKNEIYYDETNEDCIVLEFKEPKDAVRVATRFVYSIMNVMP